MIMTNNAKPIGLQTNMQETEQSFESFLTPSEQPENEIEEQASEELVNEDEVIEDNEPYEEELEADVDEDEPQEDQVEEEESEKLLKLNNKRFLKKTQFTHSCYQRWNRL